MIQCKNLRYGLPNKRQILSGINFELKKGSFLAVLGENGAGKTTLLDLMMGFRLRSSGDLQIMGADPHADPWETRRRTGYLSEKIDIPGDWDAAEFLEFHRFFHKNYSRADEEKWMKTFGMQYDQRVGNLSAGELRRLQIAGSLSAQPELMIADEITAVLDISGRRKFLKVLHEQQKERGLTVILATNVPEGLEAYADHVLLIHRGNQMAYSTTPEFLQGDKDLGDAVMRRLDAL